MVFEDKLLFLSSCDKMVLYELCVHHFSVGSFIDLMLGKPCHYLFKLILLLWLWLSVSGEFMKQETLKSLYKSVHYNMV